jgi:osmotically-inducible protein OsmY
VNQLFPITLLVSGAALATTAAAGQTLDQHMRQAGSCVNDSIVTMEINSRLAAKHLSTLTKVPVDTVSKRIVWLSGNAPTQDARDLAEMIAKSTDGVTAVHNTIDVHDYA